MITTYFGQNEEDGYLGSGGRSNPSQGQEEKMVGILGSRLLSLVHDDLLGDCLCCPRQLGCLLGIWIILLFDF